jgi:hypothetical protein
MSLKTLINCYSSTQLSAFQPLLIRGRPTWTTFARQAGSMTCSGTVDDVILKTLALEPFSSASASLRATGSRWAPCTVPSCNAWVFFSSSFVGIATHPRTAGKSAGRSSTKTVRFALPNDVCPLILQHQSSFSSVISMNLPRTAVFTMEPNSRGMNAKF